MKYALNTKGLIDCSADCLVVAIPESGTWPASADTADKQEDGLLRRVVKQGDFSGKLGSTMLLPLNGKPWSRILMVGAGKLDSITVQQFRKIAIAALGRLKDAGSKHALLTLAELPVKDRDEAWRVAFLARACEESLYRFTEFKSEKTPARALKQITLDVSAADASLEQALQTGQSVGHGMNLARDLGNTPGNVCTPRWLAKHAKDLAKEFDCVETEILDEKQMKALGMNTLLSVSAGSAEPARLIVMQYKGGKAKDKPHVLVGKGITFDTGGISLKPGEAMDEMKFDMCGAASVLGAMRAIAELKPKINVVGVIASAENMPGSAATRPGDIIKTMSGQTVEILNTDAEGRLVLCDALTYVERFKPATVVDIATLTGACIIALGHHAAGLLSNDDNLAKALLEAGERTGDRAWQLPLWDEYQSQLDSNFADIQNIGGRPAGTITAACYLSRFTKDYTWAHLDIAGVAWLSGKEKGATGRPVPLLMDYLLSHAG
ncbi:leucyl aminopeptidase [Mangrovitalea sediminis]|uniref:leucyl aminopeptidase n=1 Tax=Mangrovitalea sediminis TaxID=1982043 RepID=UPI000BE5D970|nr:leucyl aminopeptidase [Mangrovitalea sediminis]